MRQLKCPHCGTLLQTSSAGGVKMICGVCKEEFVTPESLPTIQVQGSSTEDDKTTIFTQADSFFLPSSEDDDDETDWADVTDLDDDNDSFFPEAGCFIGVFAICLGGIFIYGGKHYEESGLLLTVFYGMFMGFLVIGFPSLIFAALLLGVLEYLKPTKGDLRGLILLSFLLASLFVMTWYIFGNE